MLAERTTYSPEHDERRNSRFETEGQRRLLNLKAAFEALPIKADRATMLRTAMDIYTDADMSTIEKNIDDVLLMMELTPKKTGRFREVWESGKEKAS